jgi:type II secretory pathway pseudopilin PulG
MRRLAFTFVEILVVCAVVAIVAALAFPAFSRAKESSLEAATVSNMRQLFIAIETYRADNSQAPFGTMEEMGLPDTPLAKYLGAEVADLFPPKKQRGWDYYYYPIPSRLDQRHPNTWESYTKNHGSNTVLLADVWFNPSKTADGSDYLKDTFAIKYVIGITLEGSIRRKRASGNLSISWWDR